MKKTTILLLFWVTCVTCISGQEKIKDYFIPKSNYDQASFYKLDANGQIAPDLTSTIDYSKQGDKYVITNKNIFENKVAAYKEIHVKFTDNNVLVKQSKTESMFSPEKLENYSPPRTKLKMPKTGETISWNYIAPSGQKYECRAYFKTMNVDGVEESVLKVIKPVEEFSMDEIEYYVRGIGLWQKGVRSSNGKIRITDKLDNLSTKK